MLILVLVNLFNVNQLSVRKLVLIQRTGIVERTEGKLKWVPVALE